MTDHQRGERCPCCDVAGPASEGGIGRWAVLRCEVCGHRWLALTDELAVAISRLYEAGYRGHRVDPVFEENLERELDTVFRPRLGRDDRVLDVGCGNGAFLAAATRAGFQARGVDISESAVAFCRERGLDAMVADFLALGPDEGPFDAVTFWDVVEHLPRPADFLAQAARLTRVGGFVVVKVPLAPGPAVDLARRIPRLAAPMLHAPKHLQFFTPGSLDALLRRVGLCRVEWLPARPLRGGRRPGAREPVSAARKLALRGLMRATGCGNLYVVAYLDSAT